MAPVQGMAAIPEGLSSRPGPELTWVPPVWVLLPDSSNLATPQAISSLLLPVAVQG